MACTYRFTGTDGKQVVIKGQAAFKAFLADGGLEQLGVAAPEAPAFQRRQQNLSDLENVTFQGYVPAEVPRVQATRKLKGLVAKYDSGKINPESFVLQVRILAQRMGEASSTKETNRLFAERERGADIIQEKLLAARRRGEIDPQTTEFAMWLLGKNPNIASGLAITVKQQPQGLRGTAGDYNPAEEVMRIFKGAAKPTTAVHEILHHSERMMPEEIQDGIRKEWARAYTNALKKATPEQRVAIENMLDAMAGDANAQKIVREAFNKGTLDVDKHYQLVNPSEYWAVNATDILSRRYEADSWIAKAKQWLSEMLQKAKSIFGLRSDAPVLKGLQAVLEGKGEKLTKKMLGGQAAELEQPSFQRRQNIFAQPAPLANWTAPLETKGDNVIYALQNKQIDTKRVIEAITQAGNQIENDWNVYLQEELFHGRTAKQTTDFIQTELRPLVEDMQKRGVSLAELEEYLHNRHAEERNEQIAKVNPNMPDGGSGIDTADAEAYLAGLTPDQKRDFTALAARIDAINQNTRDLLVNSGLESQETIDAWEKSYSNYVPLYRDDIDFSTQGAGGMRTGQGYSVKGAASRRAMGSKKPVIDILANIAMQRERTIVRAEKNRVAMSLYGLAVQNPNTDFWLAIDPAGQKKPKQAIADLISMGINPLDAQNIIEEPKQQYIDPNTGLVAERINPAIRSNPMVVATRINGVEKYVFFNANDARSQRMASALKNLDADQLGYITSNFIAPVTRWFAQVNTQFNPIFGAINFIRDVQGGVLNLSSTALAGEQATVAGEVLPAMKGIYQAIRAERKGRPALAGSYAQLWDEFQEVGGQTGYRDQFVNSEDRAKALQRMLDPASWADSPLGKVFTAGGSLKVPMEVARKTAAPLFDWLSDYNQTMENAVRLASYKVALDKGLSKEEAASIAKNLTVNFNRKGQIATQAGAWYAFFNASIQGNARYIETLRSPIGKKIIAGGLMIGTAQALLLAAAGFDEDEPPDFIKERNLVIPLGTGGKYFTFPMPLGFNVIPNTSRVMTEWALSGFKNTPKRIGQITGAFLETFNPIGNSGWSVQTLAPTIFDPVVALAENKDFTGKNIAKKDRSDLSPTPGYTRAKDTASWFSKQFSYYLNLATGGTDFKPGLFSPTPDQIDYLTGQITGGVGREAMKIEQSITGAVKGEEVAPYKIPIVGRFYGDTEATANISGKFYENLTKLNKHEAEIEGRKKRGETLNEYYKDNPEARLYKKANDFESDITRLRKRLKALKERDASKESIKLVNAQITAKMKRLNDMVKEAEK